MQVALSQIANFVHHCGIAGKGIRSHIDACRAAFAGSVTNAQQDLVTANLFVDFLHKRTCHGQQSQDRQGKDCPQNSLGCLTDIVCGRLQYNEAHQARCENKKDNFECLRVHPKLFHRILVQFALDVRRRVLQCNARHLFR